ncbi:MAG: winged helix-turn-helix transcriptional regulator [Candidatus Thermoplasmatota archaeon]
MGEFLEKDVLQRLYVLISNRPGLNLSEIAEIIGLSVSEVEQYLQILERQGVLVISYDEGYPKYFIDDKQMTPRDKRTLEVRRRIYDLLIKNPGLYLSRIAELLDMSIPLTDYYLLSMERDGEIVTVKDPHGYYKRYYIKEDKLSEWEACILDVLQRRIPLCIILILLKKNVVQHKEIMKKLRLKPSTLSYHIEQLLERGIIESCMTGDEKGYVLKNKEDVIRVLRKYEFHIEINILSEGFKDLWDGFHYHK